MIEKLYPAFKLSTRIRRKFNERISRAGRIIIVMAIIAIFFGLNSYCSMFFMIFPCLILILSVSFVWSLRFRTQLICKRIFPKSCSVGQKITYSVTVKNTSSKIQKGFFYKECHRPPLPTLAEFIANGTQKRETGKSNIILLKLGYYHWSSLCNSGHRATSIPKLLPDIGSQQELSLDVEFIPERRGHMQFGGYTLYQQEPFGLFKNGSFFKSPVSTIILPKLYVVSPLHFNGSRKYHQGGLAGSMNHGDSEEFISLREYRPGDPKKNIDWKSSAKSGSIIVNQFRNEYFSRYGLVLDTFSDIGESQQFEEAVSIAASLIMSQHQNEDVLDLLFVGTRYLSEITGSGVATQHKMLKILASAETSQKTKGLSELINLIKNKAEFLSGLVLIFLDIDDKRKELLDFIAIKKLQCKTIIVCEDRSEMEHKMKELQIRSPISLIEIDKVQEQLAQI